MRTETLHNGHEWEEVQQVNTANVRTTVLEFEVPVGARVALSRVFRPVIDLRDSGGDQIDAGTRVYIGRRRPGQNVADLAQGSFRLFDFMDLTVQEQRKPENRGPDGTLRKDLGESFRLLEQDRIVVQIEGPDVIDWDESHFEFDVAYQSRSG